ncbi:MAG: hypothetical protein WAT43_14860 [Chitinophagales bacterium]
MKINSNSVIFKLNYYLFLFQLIGMSLSSCQKNAKQDSLNKNEGSISETANKNNNLIKKGNLINDSIVRFYFTDLSNIYNYELIDYYKTNNHKYFDTVLRKINIFTKDSLLMQTIIPDLKIFPWYFNDNATNLKIQRSYITGVNANYDDVDNYCGEIVVADFNFDGLEDFASPMNSGVDNGPHYAYYIQTKQNIFQFNKYLTENVIWFPEYFNNKNLTFTNLVLTNAIGEHYTTYKYIKTTTTWIVVESYAVDWRDGDTTLFK